MAGFKIRKADRLILHWPALSLYSAVSDDAVLVPREI